MSCHTCFRKTLHGTDKAHKAPAKSCKSCLLLTCFSSCQAKTRLSPFWHTYIHTDRACRTTDILQVSTTSHQIASTTEHSRRYRYLPIATPKKEVSYDHHLSIPSNSPVAETSYSLKSELGSTFRRLDDPAQEPGKDL